MGTKTKLTSRWWILTWSDGLAWSEVPAGLRSAGMILFMFSPIFNYCNGFPMKKMLTLLSSEQTWTTELPRVISNVLCPSGNLVLGSDKVWWGLTKDKFIKERRIYFSGYPCGAMNRDSSKRISLGLHQCERPFGEKPQQFTSYWIKDAYRRQCSAESTVGTTENEKKCQGHKTSELPDKWRTSRKKCHLHQEAAGSLLCVNHPIGSCGGCANPMVSSSTFECACRPGGTC